ncbi:alpha/beta fold hydrolase [Candidatus Obscuribacterales bacterium]|nr:alpha/beta fold hydrolase [Candidatus Obscuribacterales bacterium]
MKLVSRCAFIGMVAFTVTLIAPTQALARLEGLERTVHSAQGTNCENKSETADDTKDNTSGSAKETVSNLDSKPSNKKMTDEARRDLAISLIDKGNFSEAEEILRDLAKKGDSDSLMDHAAGHFRSDKYDEALKLCQEAFKKNNGKHYDKAMIKLGIAECLYKRKSYAEAEKEFQESLSLLTKNDSPLIAIFALEGLGGCYLQHKEFDQAANTLEELAKLNRDVYGNKDIGYGWALFQLSEAYKKAGRHKDYQPIYEKAIWIFRETNRKRLATEFSDPKLQAQLSKMVFGSGNRVGDDSRLLGKSKYFDSIDPEVELPRCAWRRQFRQVDAPGYVWCDPNVEATAVLICVHGLGLHHKSFNSFARRIAPRGIVTISFDVRGFGTYLASKGQDDLQIDDCVKDLKEIIKLIRADNPDKPLFLLGESMGGAIALHVAAEAPELLDGVICSVPSGARHQGASTALKVGLKYIKGKNKPMNIGEQVIKQATEQESLRNDWSNDPSARLKLTPKELVSFQTFMGQNVEVAKRIRKTPVILFQGDNDRLVKKTGTYDLFEAISSKKKTLILLGNTEHLIFEAGQFQDDVTLGVIDWMMFHGQRHHEEVSEADSVQTD